MHYATKNIRRTLLTTRNYTWRNLNIACYLIIFRKVDVSGSLLGGRALWFDSCKRPLSLHFGWLLTRGSNVHETLFIFSALLAFAYHSQTTMLKQHLCISKEPNNVVQSLKNFEPDEGNCLREIPTFSSQVSMAAIFFDIAYKGLKITQLFKLSSYVLLSVKLHTKEK